MPPFRTDPTVLLTATPREMRAVLDGLPEVPRIKTGYPAKWRWRGRSWLLLATGIGPVNAAWGLGRLLGERKGPCGVLNLGIAGSFDLKYLPPGTPVVVEEEIWPEFGLRTEQGTDAKGLGYAHGKMNGEWVWDRLRFDPDREARRMGLELPGAWERVSSLSVSGATGCAPVAERLRLAYGAAVENMEGFALAWACLQEGLPFLEVRTVSNKVGSRREEDWDFKGAFGALRSSFLLLCPG